MVERSEQDIVCLADRDVFFLAVQLAQLCHLFVDLGVYYATDLVFGDFEVLREGTGKRACHVEGEVKRKVTLSIPVYFFVLLEYRYA